MTVECGCCGESVEWWVQLRSHRDLPICHGCLEGLVAQRDGQRQPISGAWLVTGFEPVFNVSDIGRSVAFYEQLGFETSFHDETYAFAHRHHDLTIHLTKAEEDSLPGHGSIYIHCHDADGVAKAWRSAGIVVTGPEDQDYGKREGSVADLDGNVIRFGSPLH